MLVDSVNVRLWLEKVWEIVKCKREAIGYVVLTMLLFGACFFRPFAWLTAVGAVAFAVLLWHESKLLGLILYLNSFYAVFHYQKFLGITLDIVLVGILILLILGQYVYRLIKNRQQPNWKTIIPIVLFWIYAALPFHRCDWQDFFAMVFFFVLVYLVFEDRQQIDFCYLVRALVYGAIISCVFSLFKDVSPLLAENVSVVAICGKLRFAGLAFHPNSLVRVLMLGICGMLMLHYKNKVSWMEVLVTFVPMFMFGYLTLSRSFVVAAGAAVLVFAVFYVFQRKAQAVVLLYALCAVMFAVGAVFYSASQVYFERIADDSVLGPSSVQVVELDLATANLDQFFADKSDELIDAIWAGEIFLDPGRATLRELYLYDWSSSAKTIWFGRGMSQPLIAQMTSHNLYIQELWKHGIVGYLFYAAMLLGAINWKKIQWSKINWRKIKSAKRYLPVFMILVPYFLITMVEQCMFDYISLILILAAIGDPELSTPSVTTKLSPTPDA